MAVYRPGNQQYGEKGIVLVASPLIAELRRADPEATLDAMVLPMAQQIIHEWKAARTEISRENLAQKSRKTYEDTTTILRAKYAAELGKEASEISPIEVVRQLFKHSRRLKRASWTMYRAAFLWYFEVTAATYELQGWPTDSYYIAMGVLIVVVRNPGEDERPPEAQPPKRPGSMKQEHFTDLINQLAANKKGLPLKAQSFAIVTLATGVRPGEWRDIVMRPATAGDMTINESHVDWFVLEVNTSKRKSGQDAKIRTLLIHRGMETLHITQHLEFVREVMAIDPSTRRTDPMEAFIKQCSSVISSRCKQMWPKHPERWVTLYTLRSQARANFVLQFGDELASEMMGHDAEVGRKFYSAKRKGYAPTGKHPNVVPGKDVTERAAALSESRRSSAMKPWTAAAEAMVSQPAEVEGA